MKVKLFLTIFTITTSLAKQITFKQPTTTATTTNTTLIDLLANSTQHDKLLHLIQIARLVPTINSLNNATLFAPTNTAIDQSQILSKYLQLQQDNLQLELRQTLLYHLLNRTLPHHSFPTDSPQLIDTLLFPLPPDHSSTDDHLLGKNQPQKLRIVSRDQLRYIGVDPRGQAGIPLPPSEQFQNATNGGILIPIQSILTPPPSIKTLISTTPELSTYATILPGGLLQQLDRLPHLTLFAPHNKAWDHLSPIELAYLKSNFSADDSLKLFRQASVAHVLAPEGIGYSHLLRSESLNHPLVLLSIDGNHLSIKLDPNSNHLSINGSEIIEQDILASNGVLHIVPNLLIPDGDNPLQLTPEKYLLALNCTKFVSFFRQVNLSSTYLTNQFSDKSYTILAVRDDVLWATSWSSSSSIRPIESSVDRLHTNDTQDLKKSLTYHVIEGKYLVDDLHDGMLLRTELQFQGSSTSKQRIPVSVSSSDAQGLLLRSKSSKSPIIGFGGANVVGGDPIQVGNTVIYILSQIVEPPADLLQVALSDIRFSTGVASIYSAKLDEELKAVPELTYLMPTNKAFAKLGLIMDYLLLEKSKPDLIQVLKYHAVTEVIYLNELKIGSSQRYPTLEGTEVYMSKLGSHNLTVHGPTMGGVALNGESRDSQVLNTRDVLVENGSMNFIDQVELPSGLNIGLKKLMMGAKAATMLELMQASNMSWILQEPTGRIGRQGYTILCPTDAAFTKINLTYYLEDRLRLEALVRQHIIPTHASDDDSDELKEGLSREPLPFEPLFLDDGVVYGTLLSTNEGGWSAYGDVSFRATSGVGRTSDWTWDSDSDGDDDGSSDGGSGDKTSKGRWMVGIHGARGSNGKHDSARVVNYGRASPLLPSLLSDHHLDHRVVAPGGGILLLDMVLEPYVPAFWRRIGWYILLSALLLLVVLATFVGLWKGWKYHLLLKSRRDSTPVGYHVVEPMEE